jgi:WS/DGAT/MGAT family acyltransferase
MDVADLTFDDELSAFDYMMFRADMDAHSRTSLMFIETLDSLPDVDRLREQVERTSRSVPRLRQRVVAPLLPIAPARWVVDPDFTLDYHFRRVALPQPGSFRQLLDLAQVLHSTPLDLGRPLWEVTLVEGLNDGEAKAALCWKLSHTVTDGVAGMLLDQLIHQESRDPDQGTMPALPVPEDVTSLDLTVRAVRRLPLGLVRGGLARAGGAARTAGQVVRDPMGTVSTARGVVGELRRFAGSPPAEPSPVLRRRSLNRRYEALDFPLADLRAAAKARGCSVNDAYLTAIGGALRHYHEGMGVPVQAIGLAMPVNARDSSASAAGNQWSAVTIRLPVGDPDTGERMREVRESVLTARTESTLNPTRVVAPLLAWLPQQLLAGAGTGSMGFDVQASNVPGHASDRYIAGARITRSVPIGPLPGVAMMATMVSFSGQCFVGVHYDTASFTDADLLARSLRAGFDEVMASAPSATPQRRAGKRQPQPATRPGSSTNGHDQ